MAKILFITEDFVKQNSQLDENVDMKLIRSTIYDAQRDYILPILGTDLYNKLTSDISGSTLTGNYLSLTNDYVAEALLKWVIFELQFVLLYKMRNKNVSKQNSENSSPVDYTEHRYLMDHWRAKAETRSEDITRYLCANTDLFPEYTSNSDPEDIKPHGSNYTTSIYLGDGDYTNTYGYDKP
jgi:hypothetical protein